MNMHAIARELRAAADALDRCRQLACQLPAGTVDEASAFALYYDAPGVAHALYHVAGTLDPAHLCEQARADVWGELVADDGETVDLAAVAALVKEARR